MTRTTPRPGSVTAPLGALAAIIAAGVLVAACAAPGAGGGPTSAPVATNPPATNPPATTAGGLPLEVRQDASLGAYVAGRDGLSLYLFTKDSAGTSACTGTCAGTWPPLLSASPGDVIAGAGITGALGTIQRDDGTTQVTLAGAPLYYFAGDSAAGDTAGQGLNGFWFLVSPTGDPLGGAAATPGATKPAASKCSGPACY